MSRIGVKWGKGVTFLHNPADPKDLLRKRTKTKPGRLRTKKRESFPQKRSRNAGNNEQDAIMPLQRGIVYVGHLQHADHLQRVGRPPATHAYKATPRAEGEGALARIALSALTQAETRLQAIEARESSWLLRRSKLIYGSYSGERLPP